MRLLNVNTLQLKEFAEREQPPYVITSHRWGNDEATYKDVRKGHSQDTAGFKKIQAFCAYTKKFLIKADEPSIEWIWIDTCCIDKSSSAELAEAINSMFQWYAEAELCLAFLHDVKHENPRPGYHHEQAPFTGMSAAQRRSVEHSVWFTRGWTLQELLAPTVVFFVDETWRFLGYKGSKTEPILLASGGSNINDLISDITGVPCDILEDFVRARDVSLEAKQRWMLNRTTARVEDMAYCQLGIFNIFMPLIHGERDQAMERLREEVKRKYGEDLRDTASLKAKTKQLGEDPPAHALVTASHHDASGLEAIAQWDYEAREENEISFHEDERITHIEKVHEDWWMGRNAKGEEGLFPENFVKVVEERSPDPAALQTPTVEDENLSRDIDAKEIDASISKEQTPSSAGTAHATDAPSQPTPAALHTSEWNQSEAYKKSNDPKPDTLKGFRWLSGLFSTKDEPKDGDGDGGKVWVSTLPPSDQVERQRASQRRRANLKGALVETTTQPSHAPSSMTRRSTASSTASGVKARDKARQHKRAGRGLKRVKDAAASTSTPERSERGDGNIAALVRHSYEAVEENEICLVAGEVVCGIEKVDEGWWTGNDHLGNRGVFAANFVEEIEGDATSYAGGGDGAYESCRGRGGVG
ncbi:Vegetative incompatibility protein HET-E-1 [Fulvia fulva]|uniref:Vegetative incompatibility protein HET-E-1 n=1 Tax=Passalora fulva TaxID=5499 RepID=A0A9Q8PEB2_PASFU|nr:Vegetative incompatibility protein HET-E-1 [Fulvia fulva]KAK4618070.1 Vegetative incompatibility protein HET-E-1 [Fulvia fulva]KAK4618771.1 Vegetative incompatibility protein HET-E-1 [Fulvia fulva]UJO20999.1 Vegetative incompatibility protein HET-E-1 [Fulvia fulva]WPV18543.1 Vegetative incompatibility protein HET-E-1 [Fulvia fulva]WPV32967.1 Vegetative incompatibility protein HET-E-1 [Fulvia fulva]